VHRKGKAWRQGGSRGLPRAFVGVALASLVLVPACGGSGARAGTPPAPGASSKPEETAFAPALKVDLSAMRRTPSGLYVQDIKVGTGAVARRTSTVSVRYTGYLADGTILDTTGSGEPATFRLGGREVIPGWDEGIPGMKVGGIRRLVVRPELAYGERGTAGVPPGATLVFDIQLVNVR
jgi:FKBP-type peptidyl-prolyl cis-trans isomerase FkpA